MYGGIEAEKILSIYITNNSGLRNTTYWFIYHNSDQLAINIKKWGEKALPNEKENGCTNAKYTIPSCRNMGLMLNLALEINSLNLISFISDGISILCYLHRHKPDF